MKGSEALAYGRQPKKTALGYRRGQLPSVSRYSDRQRQAPMRVRNASDEKTVRTPFQKFHGPSCFALTRARAAGPTSPTRASSSFIGTFTKNVTMKPPPT